MTGLTISVNFGIAHNESPTFLEALDFFSSFVVDLDVPESFAFPPYIQEGKNSVQMISKPSRG